MRKIDQVDLPDWALPLLINGDYGDLNDNDIGLVDDWLERFTVRNDVKLSLTFNVHGPSDEFNAFPEFGLACNTTATSIWES